MRKKSAKKATAKKGAGKKASEKQPKDPKRPQPLTLKEIDRAAKIAMGERDSGPCQARAFLLLIREIELVFIHEPSNLENVTRKIRDRVFAEAGDAFYEAQDECINRYRERFFEVHGEKKL